MAGVPLTIMKAQRAALLRTLPPPVFLLCDIQERFRSLIHGMDEVVHTAGTLCSAAKVLGSPLLVTEQYSKAFGHTVPELAAHVSGSVLGRAVEKKQFSMLVPEVRAAVGGASSFVLFGIEAHVCVQQTAMELLGAGSLVYVVADGVSSQRPVDRDRALALLAAMGANVSTLESVLLNCVGSADEPTFKAVSKLLIEHNKTRPAPPRLT